MKEVQGLLEYKIGGWMGGWHEQKKTVVEAKLCQVHAATPIRSAFPVIFVSIIV